MAFLASETTLGATIVPAGRENIIGGRIRVLAGRSEDVVSADSNLPKLK